MKETKLKKVIENHRLWLSCEGGEFANLEGADLVGANLDEIDSMDAHALEWWMKWKDTIFQIIEMSPAVPTGVKDDS